MLITQVKLMYQNGKKTDTNTRMFKSIYVYIYSTTRPQKIQNISFEKHFISQYQSCTCKRQLETLNTNNTLPLSIRILIMQLATP